MRRGVFKYFNICFCGRQKITSFRCKCNACGQTAFSSSYVAGRFLCLGRFPLIPLGRVYISNECAACGHRGINRLRKYEQLHSKDLADMMEAFSSDSDNPETVLHGLHTLMVYNEEQWFMDVVDSYGRRFYDHMQVQLAVAEGLFRFGRLHEAQTHCRKAIVLGAGKPAEELLSLCQALQERDDKPPLSPESMWRPYLFSMALAAVLLMMLVATGISSTINYEAWLVNGLPVSYSIEIEGRRHRLAEYGRRQILLRTGAHEMRIVGLSGYEKTIPFVYKTSMLNQKFKRQTLVLNPDAVALLVEETRMGGERTHRYLFGEAVYDLTDIDHPFSDFPVWADTKESAQTRLFHRVPSNSVEMVEFIRRHGDSGDAAEYARRVLRADPALPDAEKLLKAATRDLQVDKAMEFLRYGTAMQPPLLEWHCFYQDMMTARRPKHDLQAEYGLLFKDHPDLPEYLYLLGRVIRSRSTAKLFLERYEQSRSGDGLGYYTIAHDLLCSGQFKEAASYIQRALDKAPDDTGFRSTAKQIHLALRQYADPLKYVEEELEKEPAKGELMAEKIKYLTLMGEHQAAIAAIGSYPAIGEGWLPYFHAARFYVSGNVNGYLDNLQESGMGNVQMERALHAGNVNAAHELVTSDTAHDYTFHLILYCAAGYHGDVELGKTELAKAIAELEESTLLQIEIERMLVGDVPPDIRRLLELRIMPREKSILCAALGFRFPDQQASFFSLSRKFNIIPDFPQLLLKKWTR